MIAVLFTLLSELVKSPLTIMRDATRCQATLRVDPNPNSPLQTCYLKHLKTFKGYYVLPFSA